MLAFAGSVVFVCLPCLPCIVSQEGGDAIDRLVREAKHTALFDGRTLAGWKLVAEDGATGYVVEDGAIVCPKDGGGKLFAEKPYGDFSLRLEFWTEPGGNNGI